MFSDPVTSALDAWSSALQASGHGASRRIPSIADINWLNRENAQRFTDEQLELAATAVESDLQEPA